MSNVIVKNELASVDYGQLAPSHAARTNWTPGKVNPVADETTGRQIPVKVGIPHIDNAGITYTRISNVSCGVTNQVEAPVSVVNGTVTEVVTAVDGSLVGSHKVTDNSIVPIGWDKVVAGTQVK